jgi:hypothetical protein
VSAEPPVINPAPDQAAADGGSTAGPGPVSSLHDPRVVQILATEHWSLLAARSLAYNEAFTRGGMFLTALSFSFVGLALLAQALTFNEQFLIAAAIVLAFDFVIGVLTYGRINGTAVEDLQALHAMARIRHAYSQIAPVAMPFFSSATHDDVDAVMSAYGSAPASTLGGIAYAFTTSQGLIGLMTSMLGGVLVVVLALLADFGSDLALLLGLVSSLIILGAIVALTYRAATSLQQSLEARFPSPRVGDTAAGAAGEGE